MSPGVALGYLLWTRHRRGLTIVAGYLLLVVFFCRIGWGGQIAATLEKGPWTRVVFLVFWLVFLNLLVGLAAALGYLLCIFSFSRDVQRFEACESGFPRRLQHLPLPTLALAGWPMLWGSAAMVLVWLALAWGALRPYGFNVPLGWPALLLALSLAWLQAIIWTPFPLPWVRAVLFFPLAGFLVFVPMALLAFDVSAMFGCILLAVLLPAAYLTAIHGVSRARRGENEHWVRPAWLRWPRTRMHPLPPFTSAERAQLWFEWRRCGPAFPLAVAFSSLFWFPFVFSVVLPNGGLPTAAAILFIFLLALAAMCGALLGRLPGREQTRAVSSFLATRPLSDGALLRAKFKVAALSTLAGWVVLGIGPLLWMNLGDHAAEIAKELETMRQQQSVSRFVAALVLLIGGVFVLIWVQMVGHLWMGLWPRSMRCDAILATTSLFLSLPTAVVLVDLGWELKESPQSWPYCAELLTRLASGAIVMKSLAAAWSLSRLMRNALVPLRVLIGALAAWIALAIGLLMVLRGLIPPEIMPLSGLVLGIVLLLPLTRLALGPLALSWNRHR
jgi:hypothetical protein